MRTDKEILFQFQNGLIKIIHFIFPYAFKNVSIPKWSD